MVLSDKDIIHLAEKEQMIDPFIPYLVRASARACNIEQPRLSYGLTSAGYDMRIDEAAGLHVIKGVAYNQYQGAIDPKAFNSDVMDPLRLLVDINYDQTWWEMPGHSYALGLSKETFRMPQNIVGEVLGKSTYARSGILINVTPAEPGWVGRLVIELSNNSPVPARIYADEGIAQMIFKELSSPPITTYADRNGKYQNQDSIVFSKV